MAHVESVEVFNGGSSRLVHLELQTDVWPLHEQSAHSCLGLHFFQLFSPKNLKAQCQFCKATWVMMNDEVAEAQNIPAVSSHGTLRGSTCMRYKEHRCKTSFRGE